MATDAPAKPIHSLILDTGPLIKNAVSISTIVNSAEEVYTTSAVISEIRDEATRSRVQTTLIPFLKVRNPSATSYDAVVAFSKKTGDFAALSRQDLGILALAYEVHCERNGGPWGLREAPQHPIKVRPGEEPAVTEEEQEKKLVTATKEEPEPEPEQKTKSKPKRVHKKKEQKRLAKLEAEAFEQSESHQEGDVVTTSESEHVPSAQSGSDTKEEPALDASIEPQVDALSTTNQNGQDVAQGTFEELPSNVQETPIQNVTVPEALEQDRVAAQAETKDHVLDSELTAANDDPSKDISSLNISTPPSPPVTDDDFSSDDDWITPSNLLDRQAADAGLTPNTSHGTTQTPAQLDVATMTIDFAMQNVLLQMNLQLLSTNMQRIKHLTSKVLRCHACFLIERDTSKQFCPRCGGASLLKVNCSTNSRGQFRLHLAKNYQYNKRGDKYSIPKPIAGTANGKWNGIGGGQGGWGRDLVLSEDQKEYVQQVDREKKMARDLMDEDYLPGILTGDRSGRAGGRAKVGAGKNVNSKRRF